jgi:hypothetical protein
MRPLHLDLKHCSARSQRPGSVPAVLRAKRPVRSPVATTLRCNVEAQAGNRQTTACSSRADAPWTSGRGVCIPA